MPVLINKIIDPKTCFSRVTLIPFGCVHSDDPGFNQEEWERCLQDIRSTPDCYAIGLGDYKNFLRTTARKHLKSYTGDEDSWRDLDQMVRKEAQEFLGRWLLPIRHKLIGLAEGNHMYEFSTGGTDTQYMCERLEVPYLSKPAFVRLQFRERSHHKVYATLKMLVHHGDWSGGYTRAGGDVNSAEMKALGFDFDIYVFSHTHRKWAMQIPNLTIPIRGALRTVERPRVFIRTGCFVRGFPDRCATAETQVRESGRYASKKLLNPTAIGYVRLVTSFHRRVDRQKYDDLRKQGKTVRYADMRSYENLGHRFEVQY